MLLTLLLLRRIFLLIISVQLSNVRLRPTVLINLILAYARIVSYRVVIDEKR